MSDWKAAKEAWDQVLVEIEEVRAALGCSASSAWMRGQPRADHKLLPFIHRKQFHPEPSVVATLELRRKSFLDKAVKRLADKNAYLRLSNSEAAVVDDMLRHRLSADQVNHIYTNIIEYVEAKREHNAKLLTAGSIKRVARNLDSRPFKSFSEGEVFEMVRSTTLRSRQ